MHTRIVRRDAIERSEISRIPSLCGVETFQAHFTQFSYARHSHESYALGTIDEGAMHFWHRGTACTVPNGVVIAINPGEVHDGRPAAKEGCRYRMLYVDRAMIDQLLENDVPQIRQTFALRGPTLDDRALACAIDRLHRSIERTSDDPTHLLEAQSRLTQVLHIFFVRHGELAVPSGARGSENPLIARAKDYLAAHLGDAIRLTELAEHVDLSPFYFLRTFKRATGMPPHRYLNQLRIERSRVLLRTGEPPASVAAMLGFVDQSHLSRLFKAAFGVTPGQYANAASRHQPISVLQ